MDGERENWVEGYRNSDKSLGQVVMSTYINREAVWTVDESAARAVRDDQQPPHSPTPAEQSNTQRVSCRHLVEHRKPGQAIRVAQKLRDGTKLCSAFQKGSCRSKTDCWEGKHFCGGLQESDRVCGGRHSASRCTNGKVKRRFS